MRDAINVYRSGRVEALRVRCSMLEARCNVISAQCEALRVCLNRAVAQLNALTQASGYQQAAIEIIMDTDARLPALPDLGRRFGEVN